MVLFNVIAFLVLKILLFEVVEVIISVPCKSLFLQITAEVSKISSSVRCDLTFLLLNFHKQLRDDTNMTSMKIVQFS